MRSAAKFALVIALAASGAANAQGVGLRAGTAGAGGDPGWWIAPSLGARIDLFPLEFGSSRPLRLTAGLVARNDRADVGGLSGMVEPANPIVPYLGIGYGHVASARVNFYFDLGVIYQGSAHASLAGACGASLPAGQCTQLQSDVAAERYGLERSLDRYGLYPVGRVGVSIGF